MTGAFAHYPATQIDREKSNPEKSQRYDRIGLHENKFPMKP